MRIRISELRGRMADQGKSVSLQDIEDATGISRKALTEISKGRVRRLIPEYVDALCTYFGVEAGELVEAETVKLPLELNIRPDRRGARVGEKTQHFPGQPNPTPMTPRPRPRVAMPDTSQVPADKAQAEAERRAALLAQAAGRREKGRQ